MEGVFKVLIQAHGFLQEFAFVSIVIVVLRVLQEKPADALQDLFVQQVGDSAEDSRPQSGSFSLKSLTT
jgi:hypothetical protein